MIAFEVNSKRKKYKNNPIKHRIGCQKAMAKRREKARANGICERCFKEKAEQGQRRCSSCIEAQRYKPKETVYH